jgi:hypothetical protein
MISDREIWNNLGIYSDIGIKFCNPFRDDKNPSAILKEWRGRLILNDWGCSEWNGLSALKCYAKVKNLSIDEAKLQLQGALSINSTNVSIIEKSTSERVYEVIGKDFSEEGLNFWKKIGVSDLTNIQELESFKITYVANTIIEKEYSIKCRELTFAYKFIYKGKPRYKIYSPYADKSKKWSGNVKNFDSWEYLRGNTTLFTLKSSKDFKVIESIVREHNIPIDLMHWQSEVIPTIKSNIPNYNKITKYKRHIVVFDNDSTGILASKTCTELLKSEAYFTPVGKDITEFYLSTSRLEVVKWLYSILGWEHV